MKNIIKIFSLLAILSVFTISSEAQLRAKVVSPVNKGSYVTLGNFPNTITGIGTADTLGVSDTVAYIIPVVGPNLYLPFISFGWTKIGSGTATLAVNFYQSNSPNNFTPVKAGVNNTTYSKSFTLSASGTNFIDMLTDSAKVSGRYLKMTYTTSSTASVQGSVVSVVNTTIQ